MDSVEFDEFGRVYIRPTHYAVSGVVLEPPNAKAPKINTKIRLCVFCEKRLSMYNTDKNNVCYNFTCKEKFEESEKKKK
jgi:hypothetical protein